MAARNVSGDGQQNTFGDLTCWANFTSGLANGKLTFLSVLNALFSVNAFLGNALILLLRSLAITDLCVGLTSEPLAIICWMSVANGHCNICRYTSAVSCTMASIFCDGSVLTLTAISVERLLALLLGMRYRQSELT